MSARFQENNDNSGRLLSLAYLTPAYAATIAVTPDAGKTFLHPAELTGALTINLTVSQAQECDELIVILDGDATGRTTTFGTGFKSSGTLATGAAGKATAHFVFDGTEFVEVSRTASLT